MKFHDILLQMDIFKSVLSSIELYDIINVPYHSSQMTLEEKQGVFTFKKSFEIISNDIGGPSNSKVIIYGSLPGNTQQVSSPGSTVTQNTIINRISIVFEIVLKFTKEKLISIGIQKQPSTFTISLESLVKPIHYVYFSGTHLLYNDTIMSCTGETETLFHSDLMNEEINLSEMISFKSKIDEILKLKVL